jgi:hypothetical protein
MKKTRGRKSRVRVPLITIAPIAMTKQKTVAGFVKQKRGKKVASFITQTVASSSAFFVEGTLKVSHWEAH